MSLVGAYMRGAFVGHGKSGDPVLRCTSKTCHMYAVVDRGYVPSGLDGGHEYKFRVHDHNGRNGDKPTTLFVELVPTRKNLRAATGV